MTRVDGPIDRIRREAADFPGNFSFYAKRLDSGEELGLDPDAVMPPASAIKLGILAELYRQAEEGRVDLEQRITLSERDPYPGSGVLRYLQPGLQPTMRDLARLMIILSDNVATARVLRAISIDAMNATLKAWGLVNTQLANPPERSRGPRGQGTSTARELAWLLESIVNGTLVSPSASAEMKQHLAAQQYGDQIPRFLPFSLYSEDRGEAPSVRVYNKTGFTVGVRVDAAIIEAPALSFIVVTMNEENDDQGLYPEHEGNLLNATAARIVFDQWVGNDFPRRDSTPLPPFLPFSSRRARA